MHTVNNHKNKIHASMTTKNSISPGSNTFLNRTECNIMRGLAIVLIVIDNITHLFKGVFIDNEHIYRWSSVEGFLNNLRHPDALLPFNLLSFYCPYGVMLFIFLSGYCLTLKYEQGSGRNTSCKVFIFNHGKKLFVMLLKGLAIFITALFLLYPNDVLSKSFVLNFLLIGNLKPSWNFMPGPYWFFGMLMEMYVIYRLLIYNRKDWVAIVLTLFSLVVMALLPPESLTLNYLRINCFLAILPFCMGVLAARHLNANSFSLNNASACVLWFALGFVFLTASKFNFYSWLIMPIFIIITAVTLVKLINRSNILGKVLGWCGTMSAILFVVHPTVREIMIERINETGNYYGMLAVYLFVTFGLSIILKPVFSNKKEKTDDDKAALNEGAQFT